MKTLIPLLLLLLSCGDGGGIVEPNSSSNFSRVDEQILNELYQASELIFSSTQGATTFSTVVECEAENRLIINGESVRLSRGISTISEFGTDFFAFDDTGNYAVIISLRESQNYTYKVPDFIQVGGNDILIYRLRPTGNNSFRVFAIYTLATIQETRIDVCVGSSGVVLKGENLIFNRVFSPVSLSLRSTAP